MGSGFAGMPENSGRAGALGRRGFMAGIAGIAGAALLPGTAAAHGGGTGTRERLVPLAGAVNTRDLGGYRAGCGRRVRWGRVYRADALGKLTDADLAKLAGLKVRTVVDFRGAPEIAKDGADRLPPGAKQVLSPVLDAAGAAMAEAIGRALATGDLGYLEQMLGGGKGVGLMLEGQRSMVLSDAARAGFGDTLRRIAEDRSGNALLYHCTAGKDRTGWMSALILEALDVPRATIVEDYMLSNVYRRASNEATYAFLRSRGVDVELIRPLMEQRPEYIEESLAVMRREYGSVGRYVRRGLGLSPSTVGHLRARLLD
jgi:protein-tyrosine phosphatase